MESVTKELSKLSLRLISPDEQSLEKYLLSHRDLNVERLEIPLMPENWDVPNVRPDWIMSRSYSYFPYDECSSSFQKAVRRGYPLEAIQWSLEMFWTGPKSARSNAWNRCMVMAVEDVGPSDPWLIIKVYNLSLTARDDSLAMSTTAYLLSIAKKCRINDWSTIIAPELDNPSTCDGLMDSIGGPLEATNRLVEGLKSKDKGACLYWSKILTFTTRKCNNSLMLRDNKKKKFINSQGLIWLAFISIININDTWKFFVMMITEIAMSSSWKWVGKTRLLMNHVITLWCNNFLPDPRTEDLNITVMKDPSIIKFVDIFWKRDHLSGIILGVPDYALDKHTKVGRKMNRDIVHFMEVAGVLFNEDSHWSALSSWFRDEFYKIVLKN